MTEAELPFIVKVCGITNKEDAAVAVEAGANALGFNFYDKSPRFVTPLRAQQIVSAVPGNYLKVGVFVNASESELLRITGMVQLDVLQLHGEQCDVPVSDLWQIWRSLSGRFEVPDNEPPADAYLLDSVTPDYGGSGKTFPWIRAAGFPFCTIVAGGLDADNVAMAIDIVRPWGVDACSLLEARPGRKDPTRVRDFVRAAWTANEILDSQEIGSL